MIKRHLTASALLAAALVLSACGSGDGTTTTGAGGTNAGGGATGRSSNDADIAFLTGMTPHHEQAVEMSEIVLAANPPADVAAIATQIKGAQAPEIEQMTRMLTDLGQEAGGGGHGGGHGGSGTGGHGGMMTEADMAALRSADGADAARLYLEGMIEHHEGAIEASETELADGAYEPARDLASSIAKAQATEITEMKMLLASL